MRITHNLIKLKMKIFSSETVKYSNIPIYNLKTNQHSKIKKKLHKYY